MKSQKFYKLARPDGFDLRNDKGQFTSEGIKAERNLHWNASGEHQRKDGRWIVRVNGIWQLRDRAFVEKELNRKLTKNEVIHHINGNKEDDQLENLQIVTRLEHRHIHPSMSNKPKFFFDAKYIKERLSKTSRTKLAKELGCNPWVLRRILGEV